MPDSPNQNDLLIPTKEGLFCPAGGFHVDPWRPVERAIVTHGHADHARRGSTHVLGAKDGLPVLERRIGGPGTTIEGVPYGRRMGLGDATVSLHPAGHVLGSAQVRIEVDGRVWVFSGDYATLPNPTCVAFEPIRCHRFITECTFGLPLYRWQDPATVGTELRALVDSSLATGRSVVLGAYGLGKAQRLIQLIAGDEDTEVPIACHGSVQSMNEAYRDAGVRLPETIPSTLEALAAIDGPVIAVAPPSALSGSWIRRFHEPTTIIASGWMTLRGPRRRNTVDHALVLSDHVDWPGLLDSVAGTECEEVGLTHGFVTPCARWFEEQGLRSVIYRTRFSDGETDPESAPEAGPEP